MWSAIPDNNGEIIANIKKVNDDFEYTYELVNGISSIKGGVKVLRELGYPQEIIEGTSEIIHNLNI